MNRINPFDLSFNQGAGKAGSINAPEKINQNDKQKEIQEAQGASAIQKSDESTMLDTNSLVDDTESLDISEFSEQGKSEDINPTNKTTENEPKQDDSENKGDDREELMAQFEELANNFFDKKNPQE